MNCKDVQLRLQSFLDRDLSETELHSAESHLRQCPPCAAMLRDFELLTRLARSELAVKAPDNFNRLLQQRLGNVRQRSRWWWLRPAPLAWSAAAVVVLVVFTFSPYFSTFDRRVTSSPALSLSRVEVTPVVLPADPGTPGTHVFIPGEQDSMLVRVPSTVKITRTQLTQDFFLSEVSH